MNDETRDLDNLTDYLMRASHGQIVTLTEALARELIARGLRGDALAADLARDLRSQTSTPRAEPLARPS
jgi:hypothetical protein